MGAKSKIRSGRNPAARLDPPLHSKPVTTMTTNPIRSFGLISLLVAVAACSSASEDGSLFGDESQETNEGASTVVPGNPNFGANSGQQTGTTTPVSTTDGNATCAVTNAEAALTKVNLVVMYDRSGSMGDTDEDPSFDPAKRWIPVGEAMKAFFKDEGSTGMSASLTFFPDSANSCTDAAYTTPAVGLTALPNDQFVSTIAATSPKGDTPTRAAMAGAIEQAQAVAAGHPGERTVLVLVTDGEPYGCGITTYNQSNAEAQNVASEVAKVKDQLPTYVIGVGPSTQNLDAVATAGGTTAFHVQVGNASQTSAQLLAAMTDIRGQVGRCDFDIPPPPDGRAIDHNKVNVAFTPEGKPTQVLSHSQDCADGTGWHFDDPNAPTKVLLCANTCNQVKSQSHGKVDVSFGCTDRPDVVR